MPLSPCVCQFCGKRYVAELSNCCIRCWILYLKFGRDRKKVKKFLAKSPDKSP